MTIPTLTTLPVAPARTDPPATFVTRADAFLAAIVTFQGEMNTSIGAMNTDIAGVNADATAAAASASAAATSESNASTSETNAATSETNAASSAAAAASSYDQFDDRYLGSKASDPAVDNDGNALLTGALYFNTTSDDMKVYTGSTWKVTGLNPDSPTFTDTVTAPSFDINSIAETKAETATDVFVYDTRKDSDGGAWRKRTQNTSWYNETLNTASRGSRKEFPAVAVIVAESNKVTIYDGDDPSLPMWMVFNCNAGSSAMLQSLVIKAVAAKNGILQIASSAYGAPQVKFIEDYGDVYWNASSRRFTNLGISDRNATSFSISNDTTQNLINSNANDIAMTVLPNAPIDAATGLPVPTIAVATDTAISVITDDGTVNDSSYASGIGHVSFSEDYTLLFNRSAAVENLQFSLLSEYTGGDSFNSTIVARTSAAYWPYLPVRSRNTTALSGNSLAIGSTTATGQAVPGMCQIHLNKSDVPNSLFSLHTNSYATGWMNGDIKLATLSDTDDTNITGSKLVTGDAASDDTNSIGSWVNSGMSVLESSTNFTNGSTYALHFTADSNGDDAYVSFPTVIGKTYTISFDAYATNYSSGVNAIGTFIGTSITGSQYTSTYETVTAASTWTKYTATFIATTTTAYLTFIEGGSANSIDAYIDNLSVRLAVEDRSVNDKGLQVFGTITKTPVATGADLVAYSGFSNITNYIEQPYNSDLDFGTGDFCVMGWCKNVATGTDFMMSRTRKNSSSNPRFGIAGTSDTSIYLNINGANVADTGVNTGANWQQVVFVRRSGSVEGYVDGVLKVTGSNTSNLTLFDSQLFIGCWGTSLGFAFGGSLALWRISATAPTTEQIAKIYEDEKFLFQENAQATLYGSTSSVNCLAYDGDTELLHVGTGQARSVFSGLRRVDNTTAGVTAAISASNGLVAED